MLPPVRHWGGLAGLQALTARDDLHPAMEAIERLRPGEGVLLFGAEHGSGMALVAAVMPETNDFLSRYSGGRTLPPDYLPHGYERCIQWEHSTYGVLIEARAGILTGDAVLADAAGMVVQYPDTDQEAVWVFVKPATSISASSLTEARQTRRSAQEFLSMFETYLARRQATGKTRVLDAWGSSQGGLAMDQVGHHSLCVWNNC